MLSTVRRVVISSAAVIGMSVAAAVPAIADDPPVPCAAQDICVGVTDPGSTPAPGQTQPGSSAGSNGGIPMCSWNGHQWPCWDTDLGWFDASNGCYYKQETPEQSAGDPAWQGHDPSSGAVYAVNCRQTDGGLTPQSPVFFAQPPGGNPPPDDPAALAGQAWTSLHFDPPVLHAKPDTAVVGVPVWLWYDKTDHTSGVQISQPAKGLTISVSLTAQLTGVHWDTGDGKPGVDCTGPGTPWTKDASRDQNTCQHTYVTSSATQLPGHTYYLTAELSWKVTETITDQAGHTTVQPYRSPHLVDNAVPIPLAVAEVQALN